VNWTDGKDILYDDGSYQQEGGVRTPPPKRPLFRKGKSHKQSIEFSRHWIWDGNTKIKTVERICTPEYADYLGDCYVFLMKPRWTKEEWEHLVFDMTDKEFKEVI
jgi:hypothetical protein